VAEAVGTALLLAAVVGSGIMGERLAGGNVALALLANTVATGAALAALILTFGPVSGAHLNPAVTLTEAWQGRLPWREAPGYWSAQVLGAFAGVATAHIMFSEPLFAASRQARAGAAQMFSEFVATFGLVAVIQGSGRFHAAAVPLAVAAYISAAYWFTASTSFANPAVTLARAATDTFTGIRPVDVPGFVLAQIAGAAAATAVFRRLLAPARPLGAPLPAAAPAPSNPAETRKETVSRVLFLCTHNAARSQMAEGFVRALAGDRFDVASAGTEATRVHPLALRAMDEVGIDLRHHTSKTFDRFVDEPWDYVITVCDSANESCPIFPGATKRLHWSFPDPSAAQGTETERLVAFRRVRDDLQARIRTWLATLEA
jgi:thioredoxin type arsenate reductase